MSYEREAMPDTVSSVVQSNTPEMREERIFSPYARIVKPPAHDPPTGQTDIVKKPEDQAQPTEDTVKLSPQVAALARREQKFRQEQQLLAQEKAKIAAEKEELAELRAMKEKLAAKDYSALDGKIDYNEYSQYQVNKMNGADPVQDRLNKLDGKISEIEKSAQDHISKQFEAAVNERRTATTELVEKSDQFPRIKKAKAHEAVVQHILDTWEHDNKELSIEQAAKEVEEILIEKAKQWSSLLEEEKKEGVPEEKKPLPPLRGTLRTLTNQVTSGDITRLKKPLHLMNDQDRYAEARRRAEEKLQKGQRT